jgi:mono/diheme cytochrome c family protein
VKNFLLPIALLLILGCVAPHAVSEPVAAEPETPAPEPEPPVVEPVAQEARAMAKTKWDTLCATCHGKIGRGDGPASAALAAGLLRDDSDLAWQKSVTDEYLAVVIVEGGAAVGKSPLMPPSPDLDGRPEVVSGLVAIVRSFAK